jgi:hypothetical protein
MLNDFLTVIRPLLPDMGLLLDTTSSGGDHTFPRTVTPYEDSALLCTRMLQPVIATAPLPAQTLDWACD